MSENYEEPQFEILKKYKKFEVRKYTDTIQARVSTDGMNYGESARPFRRLQDTFSEEMNGNKVLQ